MIGMNEMKNDCCTTTTRERENKKRGEENCIVIALDI